MNISINGIGWLSTNGFGMIATGHMVAFAPGETSRTVARDAFFQHPVKNFGRIDQASRVTLIAVSLALRDGGIDSSSRQKRAIGIVGTNSDGSLASDLDYYRDYVENGRKLSRANLFIYTLPSSPLGEAAIHFGLTGPLLYTLDRESSASSALTMAAGLVADGSAPMMLAGRMEGDEAICLLLGPPGERSLCTVDEAAAILGEDSDIDSMAARFALLVQG